MVSIENHIGKISVSESYITELVRHTSSMPAEFLNNLTKNLTSHLPHTLCVLLS